MREGVRSLAARPGRFLRNISVATRLAMVVVFVALVSVIVTSLVGLQRGRELADDTIQDRLSAIGAARGDEVERYIAGIRRAVVGQAISPRSARAIDDLFQLYNALYEEPVSRSDQNSVENYYADVIAPDLSAARGLPVSPSSLRPVGNAAIALQAEYVVPEGDSEYDSDDLPDWAEIHDPLHQAFREFVLRIGVDDFYLISAEQHVVVYSTEKEIDFGTSLTSGPQSGSGLAALINSLDEDATPGVAAIRDFAAYPPAVDQPTAFVASPVYQGSELAGYVAVRFSSDELSSITTNDAAWPELGDMGESYVVAGDDRMRSDSRQFIENRSEFFEQVEAAGTATDEEIRSMEVFGTTSTFQPIDYQQVDAALTEEASVAEVTNYLGESVLSARRALDIEGLEWAMFVEAGTDEVRQPIQDFVRNLLVAIAIFIVIVTFLAVRWAERLLRPLKIISERLRTIRDGGDVRGKTNLPDHTSREFVELGDDIDTMLNTLRSRRLAATARAAERRRVLRRLLPPQMAERAEAGDRDVVEQIPVATVAVIVVHGLGSLIGDGSSVHARELLDRFVDDADDSATLRGLERVRLTGDAYFAVCGATRLHLDHATRATSFALDVLELIEDLGVGGHLSVSAGIDSGPITVGLTGGERLLHDTWGPTVQRAADIARQARPGEIIVSSAVRAQLPTRFRVEEATTLEGDLGVVVGVVDESAASR